MTLLNKSFYTGISIQNDQESREEEFSRKKSLYSDISINEYYEYKMSVLVWALVTEDVNYGGHETDTFAKRRINEHKRVKELGQLAGEPVFGKFITSKKSVNIAGYTPLVWTILTYQELLFNFLIDVSCYSVGKYPIEDTSTEKIKQLTIGQIFTAISDSSQTAFLEKMARRMEDKWMKRIR